jgi:hypothetical protein
MFCWFQYLLKFVVELSPKYFVLNCLMLDQVAIGEYEARCVSPQCCTFAGLRFKIHSTVVISCRLRQKFAAQCDVFKVVTLFAVVCGSSSLLF